METSTLNVTPFETVFCLEEALSDWVDHDELVLVTSLTENLNSFYFQGLDKRSLASLKGLIKDLFDISFNTSLVRIALPKSLSRDYFSHVVLYHELGHFIDYEFSITDRIIFFKYKKTIGQLNQAEFREYNHYKEFFADLFSAQYVNDCTSAFLEEIAGAAGDSMTHPSTKRRIEAVKKFLIGESFPELELIQKVLKASNNKELKIRHQIIEPTQSYFNDLLPQKINTSAELHGLFKLVYDLWQNSKSNFLADFEPRQQYAIMNNLMEKSISNFQIMRTWDSEIQQVNESNS